MVQIDKVVSFVLDNDFATSVTSAGTVRTASNAETFIGGTITGSFTQVGTLQDTFGVMFLVVLRDGNTVNTPTLTAGANFYEPAENVLWHRVIRGNSHNATHATFQDKIKAKRKLKEGDVLRFYSIGNVNSTWDFAAIAFLFYLQ